MSWLANVPLTRSLVCLTAAGTYVLKSVSFKIVFLLFTLVCVCVCVLYPQPVNKFHMVNSNVAYTFLP